MKRHAFLCHVPWRSNTFPFACCVWWQALHKMKTLEVGLKMQIQVCNTQSRVSQVSQCNYTETFIFSHRSWVDWPWLTVFLLETGGPWSRASDGAPSCGWQLIVFIQAPGIFPRFSIIAEAPSLDPPQRSQTNKHREKTAEPETFCSSVPLSCCLILIDVFHNLLLLFVSHPFIQCIRFSFLLQRRRQVITLNKQLSLCTSSI